MTMTTFKRWPKARTTARASERHHAKSQSGFDRSRCPPIGPTVVLHSLFSLGLPRRHAKDCRRLVCLFVRADGGSGREEFVSWSLVNRNNSRARLTSRYHFSRCFSPSPFFLLFSFFFSPSLWLFSLFFLLFSLIQSSLTTVFSTLSKNILISVTQSRHIESRKAKVQIGPHSRLLARQ